MNTTAKENELINKLATSCYQENEENPLAMLWASAEIETQEEGGVLSSLIKKGLAGFQDNGHKDENYVFLTKAGVEIWKSNK